ncbi:hypothetical protein K4F52_009543 [Lecanicillium sp. MT-2017a]|nr:hypothetical protein K4F52_009543 [Lecanicillium sp. MT-2017a]
MRMMRLNVAFATIVSLATTFDVPFDWTSISPAPDLQFHPCYDTFQCARLTFPLDWLAANGTDDRTVAIAIIKLPAVVPHDDPSHGGTIFTQPGWPGGSGVNYLLSRHSRLRDLVDIPDRKHYDLLELTRVATPHIACFTGLAAHMRAKDAQTVGTFDLGETALAVKLAAAKADGEQCARAHGDFLEFVGTASVARDMLAMVDKLEELRVIALHTQHDEDGDGRLELREVRKWQEEKTVLPRLSYIGISYGTILGNYFASMFPGRVGRMVLDGVCDADEYAREQKFIADGSEFDAIVEWFFKGCFTAGPLCALYRNSDTSGTDIQRRVLTWAEELDTTPLIVSTPDGNRVVLRTDAIRLRFVQSMYMAEYRSQFIAAFLHDAMTLRPAMLADKYAATLRLGGDAGPANACSNSTTSSPPLVTLDTQTAIACSDGDDLTGRDYGFWCAYADSLNADRRRRHGWHAYPSKWQFKGPFKTPSSSLSRDAPAPPLLFMSTRKDPVTPLKHARKMAKRHPDAGIVVQESTGHCVSLGPFGPCVKGIVSRYFDTGEVPSGEVSCEATGGAWDEAVDGADVVLSDFGFPLHDL